MRLRRKRFGIDPPGYGPFVFWLRCSSVAGRTPLPRPALPANKMTRNFPSRGFSTVSYGVYVFALLSDSGLSCDEFSTLAVEASGSLRRTYESFPDEC